MPLLHPTVDAVDGHTAVDHTVDGVDKHIADIVRAANTLDIGMNMHCTLFGWDKHRQSLWWLQGVEEEEEEVE